MFYKGIKRLAEYWDTKKEGKSNTSVEQEVDQKENPHSLIKTPIDIQPLDSSIKEETYKFEENKSNEEEQRMLNGSLEMNKWNSQQPPTAEHVIETDFNLEVTAPGHNAYRELASFKIKLNDPHIFEHSESSKVKRKTSEERKAQEDSEEEIISTKQN